MQYVRLRGSNTKISRLGLGCMGMSEFYGPADDAASARLLAQAVERGVTHFDTADMYGRGHNERLVGRALAAHRDRVVIATKCGIVRADDPADRRIDTSPEYIRAAVDASLARLGVDKIDLFYLHRLDGVTPIEDSVGALSRLVEAGKVRSIGLCEVSVETLRRAHAVHPVSAVQSEYSLTAREPEDGLLKACDELGAAFVAYSPLGRGLLTGALTRQEDLDPSDIRRSGYLPRFAGQAFDANVSLAERIGSIAEARGVTPAQIALAWVIGRPGVVAIPGTRKLERLEENLQAASIRLTDEERSSLEQAVPPNAVEGERYQPAMMQTVNR